MTDEQLKLLEQEEDSRDLILAVPELIAEIRRLRAGVRQALSNYGDADGKSHMRMMDDLEYLLSSGGVR